MTLLLGRNKVLGRIKQGGGRIWPTGLVFATCGLEGVLTVFFNVVLLLPGLQHLHAGTELDSKELPMEEHGLLSGLGVNLVSIFSRTF